MALSKYMAVLSVDSLNLVEPPTWKTNPSYDVPSPLRVKAKLSTGESVPIPTLPSPSMTKGVESTVPSVSVIVTLNASSTVSAAVMVCTPANAKVLPSNVRLASPFKADAPLNVAILLSTPLVRLDAINTLLPSTDMTPALALAIVVSLA